MKHFKIFILLLVINPFNKVFGCWFYPQGDEVRFSIFKPENFPYKDFSIFSYSEHIFSKPDFDQYHSKNIETSQQLNVDLWRKRCNNIPTAEDVYSTLYYSIERIENETGNNSFRKYLFDHQDSLAISYLSFAKKCEELNAFYSDPWERNDEYVNQERYLLMQTAQSKIRTINDKELKLRYAFLAIRLAYYNNESDKVKKIYQENFSARKNKNIIDYWSLHFRTIIEPSGALRNYMASQVFYHATDKRFALYEYYTNSVPISETLALAKNIEERAAIWLLAGIRNSGKGLNELKNLYNNDSGSQGVSVLLLREINKLEDWIYTPYYKSFDPSINQEDHSNSHQQQRILLDRKYAGNLLEFLDSVDLQKQENPNLWFLSKAYLYFVTEQYSKSLSILNKMNSQDNEGVNNQKEVLKALVLIAQQKYGQAIIPESIKPILIHQSAKGNINFVFAIARELEFRGNTTDAAILLAKLGDKDQMSWRTKKRHHTLRDDYYNNYFFYIDAVYSSEEMKALVNDIQNVKLSDSFSVWKYEEIVKDLPKLYDLLGTKYLRLNRLNEALTSFDNISDSLWRSEYFNYKTYLNANPFYTNLYNEHAHTFADTITFTKASMIRQLMKYLKLAEDKNNPDRDYHYFLVANCYLNMSYHGNSWIMKRYFWSNQVSNTQLPDDDDYFRSSLAMQYYLKAKEASKSVKFAALSTAMAARCEKYSLIYNLNISDYNMSYEQWNAKVFRTNKYYQQLKKQYPQHYDELVSNCESFENYFRRN